MSSALARSPPLFQARRPESQFEKFHPFDNLIVSETAGAINENEYPMDGASFVTESREPISVIDAHLDNNKLLSRDVVELACDVTERDQPLYTQERERERERERGGKEM